MTRLRGRKLRIPGWVKGLVQDIDAVNAALGSYESASNMVPLEAGRLAIRGGSKLINTLHDDAGTPAELTHLCRGIPFTPVGMVIVGWSDGQNKHYATRLTAEGAFFTGAEGTSRTDLTAAPSTTWNNGTAPARPMMAEMFEKLFLCDATPTYASRNTLLSFDASGVVLQPTFSFDGGAAAVLKPYCLEEYNNVLFIAGYGDATVADAPAMVRHSFLGTSPDSATGFNKDAYNIIGASGQRVTGLKKGNGLLLIAKASELYRVTGFGRAYPGWQYQVDLVTQTLGLGVANPYALCFAEGYWYGLGAQGPFRTDGYTVDPLRGPRERAWSLVSSTEACFVEYHPDRRLIVFGVRQAAGLPDGIYLSAGGTTPATYPNVLWTWDIDRSCYGPDQGFGLSLFHVVAVPSTTPQTPQGTPTATTASGVTATGFTANWTNGDATCDNEYYEKVGVAGTYGLIATEAAGTTSKARTGLTSYTRYFYYLIHIKSGVRSGASNEIEVKTAMAAPSVSVNASVGSVTITNPSDNVTVVVQNSADGLSGWGTFTTLANQPAGTLPELFVSTGLYYRVSTEDLSWLPTTSDYSNVEFVPDV